MSTFFTSDIPPMTTFPLRFFLSLPKPAVGWRAEASVLDVGAVLAVGMVLVDICLIEHPGLPLVNRLHEGSPPSRREGSALADGRPSPRAAFALTDGLNPYKACASSRISSAWVSGLTS